MVRDICDLTYSGGGGRSNGQDFKVSLATQLKKKLQQENQEDRKDKGNEGRREAGRKEVERLQREVLIPTLQMSNSIQSLNQLYNITQLISLH